MIDPLEVIIAFLLADAKLQELVGTRVASKHRYADASPGAAGMGAKAWATNERGLMVRLDGGAPDLYAPVQNVRLEVRAYAPSTPEAMRVQARLIEISRATERVNVDVSGGRALLYRFLQDSGVSLLYDDTLGLDYVLVFFTASVAEAAVATE